MASRQLATTFQRYERDRIAFTWALADAARAEGNAAPLAALGAPTLLLPLLSDPVDTVAHTAAFALGRMAGHSSSVARTLAQAGVVGTLVSRRVLRQCVNASRAVFALHRHSCEPRKTLRLSFHQSKRCHWRARTHGPPPACPAVSLD